MDALACIAIAAVVGALAGAVSWLIRNDPHLGEALRFERLPWT